MNRVTLLGHLGADPEHRKVGDGISVTNIRMAVSRTWRTPDGEAREKTTWVDVVFWRGLADVIAKHFKKGRRILIEGELEDAEAYVNKDGVPVGKCVVTANTFFFVDGTSAAANEPKKDIPF